MKRLSILVVVFFAAVSVYAQEINSGAPGQMAKFTWSETTHEFGTIDQGKPVTAVFEFTNTGKTPLIISDVKPQCGCTSPDYSKEPIAPGKKGFVKATFNAAAMGAFNKSITVTANVEGGSEKLYIKGEVAQKETAEDPS